jgi:tRNA threonylcarbamoyl adenosine modification protein YeaZ
VIWLGIDGALGVFSAAVVDSAGTFAPRTAMASGNDALERGLALIDDVLAGFGFDALGAIAVGTGPGGFTGLRIALSYAKGLAFAGSLPLAGVSSYDALTPPNQRGTHVTFVHGRPGIACARLRVLRADGEWAEHFACGPYMALVETLAPVVPTDTHLVAYGNAAGAATAFGERTATVIFTQDETVAPALAIVRFAIASGTLGSAHVPRADYGEAHYAERAP